MFLPRVAKRVRKRRANRHKSILFLVACLLVVLPVDEQRSLRGRYLGSKNIARTRKQVENLFQLMGAHQERAYRMNVEQFNELHMQLLPELSKEFTSKRKRGHTPNGAINTKLRLSAAIRFYAGGSPLDIMLSHGMSRQSIYQSVWGTTDAVNATSSLSLNRDNAEFPSHDEQEEIAEGFKLRSKAAFDKICLAVDGMLVWTVQPTRADCEELRVGQRQFYCARKDKFGMNLMAGCDHMCRFRWADLRHPGLTSDYLAFATSDLGVQLEHESNNIMKNEYTMVGDNAWVPRLWMAVPIPGHCISGTDDAYNFYHSQVRITIERAFGIFVHRWGILRRPLSVSILRVPPLIMCLMKLHNYCIDSKTSSTPSTLLNDERSINRMASSRGSTQTTRNATAVQLDSRGIPVDLVGAGHHFHDLFRNRRPVVTAETEIPMELMRRQVALKGLKRPTVDKYAGKRKRK
ncbi:hypothetical protein ACHAW6_009449 [Cyclotella cf. meneghiniana]